MWTIILMFLSSAIAIIWSLIFLPISICGIQLNKVRGNKMKKFLKTVKHSSIWTNDEPDGWICGKWYIGIIQVSNTDRSQSKELWIFSTKSFYTQNIKDIEDIQIQKKDSITYWMRHGAFWRLEYTSRLLPTIKKQIYNKQKEAIQKIIQDYKKRSYSVCLLYGKAGGGKSMTASFLCTELLKIYKTVNYCDTHSPYEPGDNFDTFYTSIHPSKDSPLVVVFEEVDQMIIRLHNNEINQKDNLPVQIKNKTDWNLFLDKFDRDLYPHIILIMTTNKSMEFFNDLDPSYMRDGRVNIKLKF
jgi:hypothetical protein